MNDAWLMILKTIRARETPFSACRLIEEGVRVGRRRCGEVLSEKNMLFSAESKQGNSRKKLESMRIKEGQRGRSKEEQNKVTFEKLTQIIGIVKKKVLCYLCFLPLSLHVFRMYVGHMVLVRIPVYKAGQHLKVNAKHPFFFPSYRSLGGGKVLLVVLTESLGINVK